MMRLCEALAIPKGVTAVVGGGGKTALINRLCAELKQEGAVLRLTTTHCWPPDCPCLDNPTPDELAAALTKHRLAAIGVREAGGKMLPPEGDLGSFFSLADYVLIEADGSRGLPLKAPVEHEPAFTGMEALVIAVAGMSGLEQPIREAAHRPERYAALIGGGLDAIASPADAAAVLESPLGQKKNVSSSFAVTLNQCDTPQRMALGRACAERLNARCVLTALLTRPEWMETWRVTKC